MVRLIFFLFFAFALPFLSAGDVNAWFGRLFLLRHGQRDLIKAPDFDPPLTEAGRNQAKLAGAYLKKLNFHGVIYASPYRRTVETASIIAQELELPVHLLPELQEFLKAPGKAKVQTRDAAAIRAEFPAVAKDDQLSADWAGEGPETLKSAGKRVESALAKAELPPNGDVLFVTHGALLKGAHIVLRQRTAPEKWPRENWNCSLSEYDFQPEAPVRIKRFLDASFLPEELTTSNQRMFTPEQKALYAVDFPFSRAAGIVPGKRVVYYRYFSIAPLAQKWSLVPEEQKWNFARWTLEAPHAVRTLEIDPSAPMVPWESRTFVRSKTVENPIVLPTASGKRIRCEGRSSTGEFMLVENALLRDAAGRRYRVTYTERLKNPNRHFAPKAFETILAALRFLNSPR